MSRIDLFVIDGQNDFLASGNEPDSWPTPEGGKRPGALCVVKADEEAKAVAEMIDRLADPAASRGHRLNKIHASLDSHHHNDGSHHICWKNGQTGDQAPPFTIVSHDDVLNQLWVPTFSQGFWQGKVVSSYQWALNYTEALAKEGRAPLCLWPVHCEIQTWGASVYKPLQDAYNRWCDTTGGWINWITKGQWPYTEHYSALRADVIDPTRPETQMNAGVVNDAMNADVIAWLGWAGSHCLPWTAKDAVDNFGAGSNDFVKKCVFFENASAPVVNPVDQALTDAFAQVRKEFLDEMDSRGAKITTTQAFLA